jgi:hypothetical protein
MNNEPIEKDAWGGVWPPDEIPFRREIEVHGRKEHEAILRNPAKMKELGLDGVYECMVYLKRWGGWLKDE